MAGENIQAFSYKSEPQPIRPSKSGKKKYRDDDYGDSFNMMADPRIMRGSTIALARQLAISKKAEGTKGSTSIKKLGTILKSEEESFPTYQYNSTPFTYADLSNSLIDHVEFTKVRTIDCASQADKFFPRPVTPEYVPRKTGIDCSTQVEDVSELFHFDDEVEPILEVIVLKTIEQSLFEIQCEAEIDSLVNLQSFYEQKAQEELAWSKSKEKSALIEMKTKRNIIQQREKKYAEEVKAKTYVAGLQMMEQLLPTMKNAIFDECFKNKTWKHPVTEDIKNNYLEPSIQRAIKLYSSLAQCEIVLDEILSAAYIKYLSTRKRQAELSPLSEVIVKAAIAGGGDDGDEKKESKVVLQCYLDKKDTIMSLARSVKDNNAELPWIQTLNTITKEICSACGRDVAIDAPIVNFKLPNTITIIL